MANKDCKICCDHLGNVYKSLKEMCSNYNIITDTFKNRLKRGWTLEEALTEKKKTILKPTDKFSCMDHLGNTYTSQKDMAKHYKISRYTLQDRLNRGWKLKEALTLPIGTVLITKEKKCKDHLGVSYKSITDMLNTYNISQSAYNSRLKNGWGLEKTLTTPIYSYFKKCKDHLGNEHNSLKDMVSYWGIAESAYYQRKRCSYSYKEAIGLNGRGLRARVGTTFNNIEFIKYLYKGRNDVDYYLCKVDGVEKILNENSWYTYIRR